MKLFLVLAIAAPIFCSADSMLILNMKNEAILPRNFRTSKDPFKPLDPTVSRVGLDTLNISGSGQFSALSFDTFFKHLGKVEHFFDVDLRNESHGFVNGMAVSWYALRDWANQDKTPTQIQADENAQLAALKKQQQITVYEVVKKTPDGGIEQATPEKVNVDSVFTEQTLIEQNKQQYFRLYVLDHTAPTPEQVEQFVAFTKSLPENYWIHFHCAAGDGRTTTFMVLFDIIHNANKVSFDDIIHRQCLIGGIDLSNLGSPDRWKYPYLKSRYEFLKAFYDKMKNAPSENLN